MFLPFAATDVIQRCIVKSASFFEMLLLHRFRKMLPHGGTFIDAGANIGNHSVYFARLGGARMVYAFEPMRETFKILHKNVALNAPEKILCCNLALGRSPGKADLFRYYSTNIGATRLELADEGDYEVRLLDAFNFSELHAIKMDVEGAQISVLEGARETLARHKPLIWIELLPKETEESHEKLLSLAYDRMETLSSTDFIYRAQET